MDGFGYYYTAKKVPYTFCPKFMNEALIDMCEGGIKDAYPEDIKD